MREAVYGKKVAAGTMTVEDATEMTDQMKQIAEILENGAKFQVQPPQQPTGASLIAAERAAHTSRENWTPEHDDTHDQGEIISAAIAYAYGGWGKAVLKPRVGRYDAEYLEASAKNWWPWEWSYFKPQDKAIRMLVKAGALLCAEIDRLLRKNQQIRAAKQAQAEVV